MAQQLIIPIILAGGSGTRLWPVSREETPKQFCNLLDNESLFQKTLKRVSDRDIFLPPVIVTSSKHADLVATQMSDMKITPGVIICEPVGRDTAPAVALAMSAMCHCGSDQRFLVLPSDHVIKDDIAFLDAIEIGVNITERSSRLVTFGINPTHPETGYGYIRAGTPIPGQGGFLIEEFIEKPDLEHAEELLQNGSVSWNAGLFLFRKADMLEEMEKHVPDLLHMAQMSVELGVRSGSKFTPLTKIFSKIPKISIDYAVMELTNRAAVVLMAPKWTDLGSWASIWQQCERDADDNVLQGDVLNTDTSSSLVISDGPLIAVAGMKNVVVVANNDAVLVADRENTQGVKALVESMKIAGRREQISHLGEDRPWGRFDSIDRGTNHQVKKIRVNPNGQLSLQYHHHRAEHWVVVSGTARVTVDDEVMELNPCEQIFIPQGAVHRLENVTDAPVEIIEVQYGNYLGEDDIVRIQDVYGRDRVPGSETTIAKVA